MSLTREQLLAQSEDSYMSDEQLGFFKGLLLAKADALMERIEAQRDLCNIERHADEGDLAAVEATCNQAARMIERDNQSLKTVRAALENIASGDYGYCSETGASIGLERLLAVPESFMCIEAMRAHEARARHLRAA